MLRDSVLVARRSRALWLDACRLARFGSLRAVHCVAVSFAALNKQTNKHTPQPPPPPPPPPPPHTHTHVVRERFFVHVPVDHSALFRFHMCVHVRSHNHFSTKTAVKWCAGNKIQSQHSVKSAIGTLLPNNPSLPLPNTYFSENFGLQFCRAKMSWISTKNFVAPKIYGSLKFAGQNK
jgi:hypothetical protein